MQFRKFIVVLLLLGATFDISFSFSCQGAGISWKIDDSLLASCSSVPSCVPFSTSEISISGSEITMQRCYTQTYYNSRIFLGKTTTDDLFLYNTFRTVSGATYTVSFDWDGLVINNDCTSSKTDVLMLQIIRGDGIGKEEIMNVSFFCSGTICGTDNSSGYIHESISFTALDSQTTIVFRTLSNKAVRIKIKDITINSTQLPCQEICGGDPRCNGYLPNSTTGVCNLNNTLSYFEDRCDINCQVVEITDVCRSSIFSGSSLTCTGSVLCEGVAPNTCFGSELCYSDCGYYNVNDNESYCSVCGYHWVNNTCCGDEENEVFRSCEISGESCEGEACCPSSNYCVWENICYENGSSIIPSNIECGKSLLCENGVWRKITNISACNLCGSWVGNSCCYKGKSYNFTDGACIDGEVISCSNDGKCAIDYGIPCSIDDPDCKPFTLDVKNASLSNDFRKINFEVSIFSPKISNISLVYKISKDEITLLKKEDIKFNVKGGISFNESVEIPEDIFPGEYYLFVEANYNGEKYSDSSKIFISNNCINITPAITYFGKIPVVVNKTTLEIFNNKSIDFYLENICDAPIENATAYFMNFSAFLGKIENEITFHSYPRISTFNEEIVSIDVFYSNGFTTKTFVLQKFDVKNVSEKAINKFVSANSLLKFVQLKSGLAFLTAEQYSRDMNLSVTLIRMASNALVKKDYMASLLYSENAIKLLLSIDDTLTLPFLVAVTILIIGSASSISIGIYLWWRAKHLKVKSP